MCANNRAAICPECDTQPVAKPRSGNRVRVLSHATRLAKARLKSVADPTSHASPSPRTARRAPAARVMLTKPAHRQVHHSRSRAGKVPSTGEREVVKSS